MTRVAAIDCGTNSIRLLVADAGEDGRLTDVTRLMRIVRLGQGVDATGAFAPEAIERLCALFLDTYIASSRAWIPDAELLRGRAAVYELISLIRLALHSWEKMKGSRLKQTLGLLEERIECQKQISLSLKNRTP